MGVKKRGKGDKALKDLIKQAGGMDGTVRTGFWNQGETEMIAGVHEFGKDITVTPKMRAWFAYQGFPLKPSTMVIHIPERSFIRAGYDANQRDFQEFVDLILFQALNTGIPKETVMDMLSRHFKGKIQEFMRDLKEPPKSDMTLAMHPGKENPLMNSGHLVESIRSEPVKD